MTTTSPAIDLPKMLLEIVKARKRTYLDSTDDPELVESVVYELEAIEKALLDHIENRDKK